MKDATLKQLTIKIGVDEDLKSYILIKDTGCGISKEVQEKIFIPFYTTKDEGSGIGLSLSRQIIQLHGGKILVQTEEGIGSEFRLIFRE